MTKKEKIINVLENMGYKPQYDEEGDIIVRYQLKTLYILTSDDDEDSFVNIILPQFVEFEEGEETLYLATCNKLTREKQMVKVYVDQTFKNVSASYEFYYVNDEALEKNLDKAFGILGILRIIFRKSIMELSE